MKENPNPFTALVLYCIDIAAAEYIAGKMSFDEAVDYGFKLTDKYSETEEFNKVVDDYFSGFVNIRDIGGAPMIFEKGEN